MFVWQSTGPIETPTPTKLHEYGNLYCMTNITNPLSSLCFHPHFIVLFCDVHVNVFVTAEVLVCVCGVCMRVCDDLLKIMWKWAEVYLI